MSFKCTKAHRLGVVLLLAMLSICEGIGSYSFEGLNAALLEKLDLRLPLKEIGRQKVETRFGPSKLGIFAFELAFGGNHVDTFASCSNFRFSTQDAALRMNTTLVKRGLHLQDVAVDVLGLQFDCRIPLSVSIKKLEYLVPFNLDGLQSTKECGMASVSIGVKLSQTASFFASAEQLPPRMSLGDCQAEYSFDSLVLKSVFTLLKGVQFPFSLANGWLNTAVAKAMPTSSALWNEPLSAMSCDVLKKLEQLVNEDISRAFVSTNSSVLNLPTADEVFQPMPRNAQQHKHYDFVLSAVKQLAGTTLKSMDDPFNLLQKYIGQDLLHTDSAHAEPTTLLRNFDVFRLFRQGGLLSDKGLVLVNEAFRVGHLGFHLKASLVSLTIEQHKFGHIDWSKLTPLDDGSISTPGLNFGEFGFKAGIKFEFTTVAGEGSFFGFMHHSPAHYMLHDTIQITGKVPEMSIRLGISYTSDLGMLWNLPLDRLLLEPLESMLKASMRSGEFFISAAQLRFALESLDFLTPSKDAITVFATDALKAGALLYGESIAPMIAKITQNAVVGVEIPLEGLLGRMKLSPHQETSANERLQELLSYIPRSFKQEILTRHHPGTRILDSDNREAQGWELLARPLNFELDFMTHVSLRVNRVRVLPSATTEFSMETALVGDFHSKNGSLRLAPHAQVDSINVQVHAEMNISGSTNRFVLTANAVEAELMAGVLASFDERALKRLTLKHLTNMHCWLTLFAPGAGIKEVSASIAAMLIGLDCVHCEDNVFHELAASLQSSKGVAALTGLIQDMFTELSMVVTNAFDARNWNNTVRYAHEQCFGFNAIGYNAARESDVDIQEVGQSSYFMLGLFLLLCFIYSVLECSRQPPLALARKEYSLMNSREVDVKCRMATTLMLVITTALFGYSALQVTADQSIKELGEAVEIQNASWLTTVLTSIGLAWPLVKLLALVFCWISPARVLSSSRRGQVLHTLDVLGKWSLLELFALLYTFCFFLVKIESPKWPFLPRNMYMMTFESPIPPPLITFGSAVVLCMVSSNVCLLIHHRVMEPEHHAMESIRLSRTGRKVLIGIACANYTLLFALWSLPLVQVEFYGLGAKAISLGGHPTSQAFSLIDILSRVISSMLEPALRVELLPFAVVLLVTHFIAPLGAAYSALNLAFHDLGFKAAGRVQLRQELISSWSSFLVVYMVLIMGKMDLVELITHYVEADSPECMQMKTIMGRYLEPMRIVTNRDVEAACFGVELQFRSGMVLIISFALFATLQQYLVSELLTAFRTSIHKTTNETTGRATFWINHAERLGLVKVLVHGSIAALDVEGGNIDPGAADRVNGSSCEAKTGLRKT